MFMVTMRPTSLLNPFCVYVNKCWWDHLAARFILFGLMDDGKGPMEFGGWNKLHSKTQAGLNPKPDQLATAVVSPGEPALR
jgi:hypothetical protein